MTLSRAWQGIKTMRVLDKYIFRGSFISFLAILTALTTVIWLTQALREFNLISSKGQALLSFFKVTSLIIPSLLVIIAPIALFISILYSLNKLNSDSELIVMNASGLSPLRLLISFSATIVICVTLVAMISLWIMPWSLRVSRDLISDLRADFITNVVRPGNFNFLEEGLVFHYRERGEDGSLLGILIQDRRETQIVNTYLAERGYTVTSDGSNYLVLEKGSVQRLTPKSLDPAMVQFERYALDLSQFGGVGDATPLRPRERSTWELIHPDQTDPYYIVYKGRFRTELHDRMIGPLYAVMMGLIAFAALAQAHTTRQGRGLAIGAAVLIVIILRVTGIGLSAISQKGLWTIEMGYMVPILGSIGALIYTLMPHIFTFNRPARPTPMQVAL